MTPTASFAEQSRQLQVLYEEARKARLTTESLTWTELTPEPVVATTSLSAAALQRRRHRCAGPIYWSRS